MFVDFHNLSQYKSVMPQTLACRRLLIAFFVLPLVSAIGQIGNVGTLNTWTTKPISREHGSGELVYVKKITAAKHKDFDRVVFEFEKQIPNYRIEYLKSHFYQGEAERVHIRSAGHAFVQAEFFTIPTSEEQLKLTEAKGFRPKGRLRMPAVQSVTDMGLFEGFFDFVIGVGSRKPFQVTELSNPARLVIDFKH
jgi:hypothetical protein